MLQVHELAGGYRPGVTIYNGVNFDVAEGDAIGFIGRNGVGKSCIAKTLSGALPPFFGTIRYRGQDVTKATSRERVRDGISLVPEGRLVFGQLTVNENLLVAAQAVGLGTGAIGRFEEMFPILGEKRKRLAASLSGGEQQLLAIARSLIQSPSLMILDEPSLGLSPIAVERLCNSLQVIANEAKVTMILMEQNAQLLTNLCSTVFLVDHRKVARSLDMSKPDDQKAIMQSYLGV